MNPIWKHAPQPDDGWHTELEWPERSIQADGMRSWGACCNHVLLNIEESQDGQYNGQIVAGAILSDVYRGGKSYPTFAAAEAALIAAIDEIRLAK